MNEPLTPAARSRLCLTQNVTLNGEPASITGWADDVATVFQIGSTLGTTFSWARVARIVTNNGGRFIGAVRYLGNDD